MLIIPEKPENFYEPVKTTITYRGAELVVMIRPYDFDAQEDCRKKATKVEAMKDPETGELKRVEYTDKDAHFAAMADHVIASFSGPGYSDKKPWPVDLEHKMKLLSILPGTKDKKSLLVQVLDTAKALAADQFKKMAATAEAETKNS